MIALTASAIASCDPQPPEACASMTCIAERVVEAEQSSPTQRLTCSCNEPAAVPIWYCIDSFKCSVITEISDELVIQECTCLP
jgi:hypothetical protein